MELPPINFVNIFCNATTFKTIAYSGINLCFPHRFSTPTYVGKEVI